MSTDTGIKGVKYSEFGPKSRLQFFFRYCSFFCHLAYVLYLAVCKIRGTCRGSGEKRKKDSIMQCCSYGRKLNPLLRQKYCFNEKKSTKMKKNPY